MHKLAGGQDKLCKLHKYPAIPGWPDIAGSLLIFDVSCRLIAEGSPFETVANLNDKMNFS